ncbi:SdpA family antimicrobial peptide system protein [Viridibacillus sp. YIM B01967]|uniref:SdpA family antimicrobial peptide system protein n=1 Tax=Viridibacillus soli TaxID=2798301 RepID=A0ABS1H851_9BACL|nr:SdpA family antimicrobial peptide system protein [Viridibacillus soli]MBK3495589.1 SdpA family antimicrobial peptide system protein [Viridibacillus soli]
MNFNKYSYVKFGTTFLAISILWLGLFFCGIQNALPPNPIKELPFNKKLNIITWFPQGWGFYSKSPRDAYFSLVDVKSGELSGTWPNNLPQNYFGLKRFGRSQGIEAGMISSKVTESLMQECKDNPQQCLTNSKIIMNVENDSPNPTICGDIGIVSQDPKPWAWSKRKINMPSKIARVNVTCSKK